MSSLYTDPDKWYEAYEPASKQQRYELMLETLEQPLSDEFIRDGDLGMFLLETKEDLVNSNLIQEAFEFIETFRTKFPRIYAEDFFYYDEFLVTHALFRDEPRKAEAALAGFVEHPITAIDELLNVFDLLRFYGATDLAVSLAQKTCAVIKRSPKILSGAEYPLESALFANLISDVYAQLQRGEEVDWDSFLATAKTYAFTGGQPMIDEIRQHLTTDTPCDERFTQAFKNPETRANTLMGIVWEFCRDMRDRKGVPFLCSEALWSMMINFLEEGRDTDDLLPSPAVYFQFAPADLEEFLVQMLSGFMSNQQHTAVAMLWGIPYIYDFLLARGMITEAVHRKVNDVVNRFKPDVIKGFNTTVWKYDFVHRWTRPDSVSEAEFQAEADQFRTSIEDVRPLSEKPYSEMDRLREMFGEV